LSRSLEVEFGGKAKVEFVCQFPVVGAAPCVIDNSMDSREVKLTLTELPSAGDTAPDEQAFAIARLAHETSSFAREADRTEVSFQDGNVVRTYSFTRADLLAGAAQNPDSTGHLE
jgi:hypothetical protein